MENLPMVDPAQTTVQSPCIGVCTMNDTTGLCLGCYRTTDEIKAWWDMTETQQKALLNALQDRQLSQANFDD